MTPSPSDPPSDSPSEGPAAPSADGPGAPARFTGDARPYTGGDPYADYRAAPLPFTHHTDLADRRLGAGVLAANDEFFAQRENLLLPGPAVFEPGLFGHKGKIMDGWETRRRRGPSTGRPHPAGDDHDWALIRLGAPGVVHGIVVDTAHFRGNHPRSVSVEATAVTGTPAPEELGSPEVTWTPLVPRTVVGGHAANGFTVTAGRRFTHLRLRQYPDGGIARLRVHGEVVPDPEWLGALGTFDLVALEHGGRVTDASDRFYSPPENTIRPGRSRRMDDGWETRRRRDGGGDWIRYRLTERARIRAVEIDTAYLLGNSAGWARLSVRDGDHDGDGGDGRGGGGEGGGAWSELLPMTRLQPDTNHRFVLPEPRVGDGVRIDIHPDGGIARLRVLGELTDDGAARLRERHRLLGG
ncbi:allantoicase [Streptomyces sp. NPDC001985]|uniref:allantoicase n=1 Tax=Streptomyces sp. NPDC001985 TaxID=3154406 RepID=UPI0033259AC3